jgi:hypothetical protein
VKRTRSPCRLQNDITYCLELVTQFTTPVTRAIADGERPAVGISGRAGGCGRGWQTDHIPGENVHQEAPEITKVATFVELRAHKPPLERPHGPRSGRCQPPLSPSPAAGRGGPGGTRPSGSRSRRSWRTRSRTGRAGAGAAANGGGCAPQRSLARSSRGGGRAVADPGNLTSPGN